MKFGNEPLLQYPANLLFSVALDDPTPVVKSSFIYCAYHKIFFIFLYIDIFPLCPPYKRTKYFWGLLFHMFILSHTRGRGDFVALLEFYDAHALRGTADLRNGGNLGSNNLAAARNHDQVFLVSCQHFGKHQLSGF